MAVDGKIVIRPMMYVALSYDHRIVDGKGAVTFLVQVKEIVEDPDGTRPRSFAMADGRRILRPDRASAAGPADTCGDPRRAARHEGRLRREDATLGGTCLNVGCIPSARRCSTARAVRGSRPRLRGTGVRRRRKLDLAAMMRRKDAVVRQLTEGVAFLFKKNKIERSTATGGSPPLARSKSQARTARRHNRRREEHRDRDRARSPSSSNPSRSIDEADHRLDRRALAEGAEAPGRRRRRRDRPRARLRLGAARAKVTVIEFLDRILPGMDAKSAKHFQRSSSSRA